MHLHKPANIIDRAMLCAAVALTLVAADAHGTPALNRHSEDPSIRCAANPKLSTAIPFERVQPRIELVPPHDEWHIRGPKMLVVVTDSTMWPAVWSAAVDSVKVPRISFGNRALVLVSTRTYWRGNTELRVTAIRQCRANGVVVVSTLESRPRGTSTLERGRGIDLVSVRHEHVYDRPVIFDQRIRFGPKRND